MDVQGLYSAMGYGHMVSSAEETLRSNAGTFARFATVSVLAGTGFCIGAAADIVLSTGNYLVDRVSLADRSVHGNKSVAIYMLESIGRYALSN